MSCPELLPLAGKDVLTGRQMQQQARHTRPRELAWDVPSLLSSFLLREARLARDPTVTPRTATGRCAKPGASCASSR